MQRWFALGVAVWCFAWSSSARAETAGWWDSSVPETSPPDTGPPDTTMPDTTMPDTGMYDTAVVDPPPTDSGMGATDSHLISKCSADGTGVLNWDGVVYSCMPYRCKSGACATTCSANADCSPGFECSERKCLEATTTSPDPGTSAQPEQTIKYGCGVGGAPSGLVAIAAVVAASCARLRRRCAQPYRK